MADLEHGAMTLARAAAASGGFDRIGVSLKPEPFLGIGKIQFLGEQAADLFQQIFGRAAPAAGGSFSLGGVDVSWLAPGEWLVTGGEPEVRAALDRADAVAGDAGLATDLGHARASFLLSGRDARDRLAAVTPLDISHAAIPVGDVARAPLGDTSMFLARLPDLDGEPSFRIVVDQTMAAYAVRMLAGPAAPSRASS